MEVFDFIVGDDGDLFIKNGDLAFGESTEQHQRDLVLAMPGEFRQSPLIGCGIRTELLNSIAPDELRIAIQREFERDGMQVVRLAVNGDAISIDAHYVEA